MSVRRPVLSFAMAALAVCALAGAAAAADMQAPPSDADVFVPPARRPAAVVGPAPAPRYGFSAYSSMSASACREVVPDGCFRRWFPVHLGGGYEPPLCAIYCPY